MRFSRDAIYVADMRERILLRALADIAAAGFDREAVLFAAELKIALGEYERRAPVKGDAEKIPF